jgi:hypothetical protein
MNISKYNTLNSAMMFCYSASYDYLPQVIQHSYNIMIKDTGVWMVTIIEGGVFILNQLFMQVLLFLWKTEKISWTAN